MLGTLLIVGVSCTPIELSQPLVVISEVPLAPSAPLEVAWDRNVEGALGPGAPIVTKSFLTLGTRRGDVGLVDLEKGVLDGSSSFGRSIEGGVVLAPDGRRAFIPLASGEHGLLAHDLVAGRRLWRASLGPVQTTPVLFGNVVVAAAMNGTVEGLAVDTGEPVWTHRPDTMATYRASPLPLGGDVVFANDRGEVVSRIAATGALRWSASVGGPVYTSMAAGGDHVLVPTTRGTLTALSAATGETAWQVDLGEGIRMGAPLVVGDQVIVGTSTGEAVALDLQTGAERWRTDVEGVVRARPARGDGVVYVGTMARQLLALDLDTGAVIWETTARGRIKTDLTVAGDLLIVATEPRHIVAYRTVRPNS
ncbi:MAG: hypothetical protein Rubg2KO_19120 [Rubricoccaceae bacterium]